VHTTGADAWLQVLDESIIIGREGDGIAHGRAKSNICDCLVRLLASLCMYIRVSDAILPTILVVQVEQSSVCVCLHAWRTFKLNDLWHTYVSRWHYLGHVPKIIVFWKYTPNMDSSINATPKKALRCAKTRHMTYKRQKASHTRYRALGPELIPVYRQSACRKRKTGWVTVAPLEWMNDWLIDRLIDWLIIDWYFIEAMLSPYHFRGNRWNCWLWYSDLTVFTMAAFRHLRFIMRVFGPSSKSIWWYFSLCNIWLDSMQQFRCYASFNILQVKLKNVYSCPKNGGFWGFHS